MAKRVTGIGKGRKTKSHKTKKRLEIKREMLEKKAARVEKRTKNKKKKK
jgi:hypothetical protein